MSVYKRGETYWFKFLFQGQQIRESARTTSKTVAREAERARRRDLELGLNRIGKRKRTPLFATAAKEWIEVGIVLRGDEVRSLGVEDLWIEEEQSTVIGV